MFEEWKSAWKSLSFHNECSFFYANPFLNFSYPTSTQTGEDDMNEEVQTEEQSCDTKWVQHPAQFFYWRSPKISNW
uniref:Ovule protein n=1 Tax=Heterorhabditis bacteriophora TaxID=37862 RepID=A0A1I7WR87_HETBA